MCVCVITVTEAGISQPACAILSSLHIKADSGSFGAAVEEQEE